MYCHVAIDPSAASAVCDFSRASEGAKGQHKSITTPGFGRDRGFRTVIIGRRVRSLDGFRA